MANHKQSIKRHKQSLVRRARNQHFKTTMRTYLKQARLALEEKSGNADEAVKKAVQIIDRVAQKGIIPKNTAARTISRLMKQHAKG